MNKYNLVANKLAIYIFALLVVCPSVAISNDWAVEITPYAWLAGVDADVTVGNREVDVDVGFSDLLDNLDFAAAFLAVAQYDRFVLWGQVDYLDLNTGDVDTPIGVDARAESKALFLTTAAGYQFDGFVQGSTIDVLLGLRYLRMKNKLSLEGFGTSRRTRDLIDAVLVVRPSFQLSEKWRFNPTLSIGAGDSDLTYEIQPQFQYQFNDTLAARLGYRRLYYDVDKNNFEFDGAFHGFLLGLGFAF